MSGEELDHRAADRLLSPREREGFVSDFAGFPGLAVWGLESGFRLRGLGPLGLLGLAVWVLGVEV